MKTTRSPLQPSSQIQKVPFLFESTSTAPDSLWNRKGKGEAVFSVQEGLLQIEESGTWWEQQAPPHSPQPFQKRFRLEKTGPDELRILKPSPTGDYQELVKLVPGENGDWFSPIPHHCIDDVYRAELSLKTDGTLLISWWSEGPRKQYDIHTQYLQANLCRAWLET